MVLLQNVSLKLLPGLEIDPRNGFISGAGGGGVPEKGKKKFISFLKCGALKGSSKRTSQISKIYCN